MDYNYIKCGNCVDILEKFSNNIVDLTITSPPYDNLRKYKGYEFDFEKTARELFRITKDGGVVCWIVNDKIKDGDRSTTSFKQAEYFKTIGFKLNDIIVYGKTSTPFPRNYSYSPAWEPMFVLTKRKPKIFNPIQSVNKSAGIRRDNLRRIKDGKSWSTKQKKEGKRFTSDKSKRSNIWMYDVGGNNMTKDKFAYNHPAIMPEKLARDCIVSWSNENNLVLDPLCGSGTVLKMAKLLNRNYIGIDISEEYVELSKRRIQYIIPQNTISQYIE